LSTPQQEKELEKEQEQRKGELNRGKPPEPPKDRGHTHVEPKEIIYEEGPEGDQSFLAAKVVGPSKEEISRPGENRGLAKTSRVVEPKTKIAPAQVQEEGSVDWDWYLDDHLSSCKNSDPVDFYESYDPWEDPAFRWSPPSDGYNQYYFNSPGSQQVRHQMVEEFIASGKSASDVRRELIKIYGQGSSIPIFKLFLDVTHPKERGASAPI
jgi:hypothetical protein